MPGFIIAQVPLPGTNPWHKSLVQISVQGAICLFEGGDPKHHLHILGGVLPKKDRVEVVLLVQHAYQIYSREALILYVPWYR